MYDPEGQTSTLRSVTTGRHNMYNIIGTLGIIGFVAFMYYLGGIAEVILNLQGVQ
jgi:hypothetical protein